MGEIGHGRKVLFHVESQPDDAGRQRWWTEWRDKFGRRRAQQFNAKMAPHVAYWKAQGWVVEVIPDGEG